MKILKTSLELKYVQKQKLARTHPSFIPDAVSETFIC